MEKIKLMETKTIQDYSQCGEQLHLLNYFGEIKGTFMDIGANDGKTFSNSYALALLGWHGVCVEPTDRAFNALSELYKNNKNVQCLQYCIGDKNEIVDFWEPHDTLVATTNKSETHKWERGLGFVYEKFKKEMITVEVLLQKTKYKQFDFINIDVEGNDFQILKQFDLRETKAVCIEVNEDPRKKYIEYMKEKGFFLLKDTNINLIFAK